MHKIVCLSVFVVFSTLLIECQAQPVYTTYQQNVDMGAKLKTSAAVDFPFYLHFYFTANSTTLYGAAVTNYTGWIGVGLSYSGKMINGGFSDAIVTYYDTVSSQMLIKDLSLSAQTVGTQGNCKTGAGVCADEDKTGCVNNVELVNFHINGSYYMWEFTRPLAASDACDRAVPVGTTLGYIIAAAGLMNGGTALPYNMQQHNYRTPTGYYSSIPTGPVPLQNGTTTTSTSTSTSGTSSTSSTSTGTSSTSSTTGSSTSGTTSSTGTTGSTVTTGGTSTTGSSGVISCTNDISQQCLDECAPHFVDYCRCNITTNTLIYVCKDSFSAAMSFGTPAYWIALILGLVALVLQ